MRTSSFLKLSGRLVRPGVACDMDKSMCTDVMPSVVSASSTANADVQLLCKIVRTTCVVECVAFEGIDGFGHGAEFRRLATRGIPDGSQCIGVAPFSAGTQLNQVGKLGQGFFAAIEMLASKAKRPGRSLNVAS